MELAGTVAIVTGGARGLGKAIAEALIAQDVKVALVDVLAEPLAAAADELGASGGDVLAMPCDITSADRVARMASNVKEQLGTPRILINSAGSLSALGPIWSVDADRWCKDAIVNLCGTFLVCRHVVELMVAGSGGYVINLVGAGTDRTHPYTSAYDSSKAAVMRLTEALAHEAAEACVKAFALYPGTVRTAMTEFILESPEGRKYRPTFRELFETGRAVGPEVAVTATLEILAGSADALSGRWLDAKVDFPMTKARVDKILSDNLQVLRLRR